MNIKTVFERSGIAGQIMPLLLSVLLLVAAAAGQQALAASSLTMIPGSLRTTTDSDIGEYSSAAMTVELVLAPSNASQLSEMLSNVYNPQSSSYQQWLSTGEFASMFAPSSATVTAITDYLQSSGLTVHATASPFLLAVTGKSSVIASALNTTLHNYSNSQGETYFANALAVQLPNNFASAVLGVVGLTNTIRLQSHVRLSRSHHPTGPPCETPYVTVTELFNFVNNNTDFPYGYGGGPGCSGLTPAQTNSIYGAPNVGRSGQGSGVHFAVFELSAYLHSDIDTWTQQFYGPGYRAPLTDVIVDGGPLNPICPTGDQCPAQYNGYSGDIEVDADIEMTLAIAPALRQLLVYNAPDDFTGQTELDEYVRIAHDNVADVISSSWGTCEDAITAGYALAENLIFEQMALQGQSMFSSAGDTGAFTCQPSSNNINAGDPSSQPWVTSVGGTSFESFNPGADPNPSYPYGIETVWNVDGLCNTAPAAPRNDDQGGYFWCSFGGAGGGGYSQWWGRPSYQSGPGVNSPYTVFANGSTQCALARSGTPCREVPDISANADEYTPYAEYCTGNPNPPDYSTCGEITSTPAGWFGIGGTSLSSPLWAALIGDRDGYWGGRTGNANPLLYRLLRNSYFEYFNDITGFGQSTTNNGYFPVTPFYDMATGIGTPKMGALITGPAQ